MNRSSQHPALILRVTPSGESHGSVDLVTPDDGLISARAYGIRSSRSTLRGKVIPFARGTVWLYRDQRRESVKITDFAVDQYGTALSENLTRFGHASLWAEVVWRTFASGGEEAVVYDTLLQGLSELETLPVKESNQIPVLSMILLWRYIAILGVQPDIEFCGSGERHFVPEEPRYYDSRESAVVGREWAGPGMVEITPGVVRLLRATEGRALGDLKKLTVTSETERSLRQFVLAVVQDAVHSPLRTLEVAGQWL